jgi:hypothetical protein
MRLGRVAKTGDLALIRIRPCRLRVLRFAARLAKLIALLLRSP